MGISNLFAKTFDYDPQNCNFVTSVLFGIFGNEQFARRNEQTSWSGGREIQS